MPILYLHGLNSSPKPSKIEVIRFYSGSQVIAPQIDYSQPDIFDQILTLAEQISPKSIIGSSMGGFMGYHVAKHIGCTTLLFNPALLDRQGLPIISKKGHLNVPMNFIVLGGKDTIVPPLEVMNFISTTVGNYTIWWEHEMGHQIPDELESSQYFQKFISRFFKHAQLYTPEPVATNDVS
jgi:predicted esterase YcpF (UPF0227 family)